MNRDRKQRRINIPGEDILGMVIPQVDLCWSTNGDALGFHVYSLE